MKQLCSHLNIRRILVLLIVAVASVAAAQGKGEGKVDDEMPPVLPVVTGGQQSGN